MWDRFVKDTCWNHLPLDRAALSTRAFLDARRITSLTVRGLVLRNATLFQLEDTVSIFHTYTLSRLHRGGDRSFWTLQE